MLDIHKQYTPGEAMEKALRYAFAVWIRIGRYVQDGRFNIDNNLMEQAIRPITLGRKNYLFCGNNEGAENNAIFYTFMACCREADIDPYKWMKETFRACSNISLHHPYAFFGGGSQISRNLPFTHVVEILE